MHDLMAGCPEEMEFGRIQCVASSPLPRAASPCSPPLGSPHGPRAAQTTMTMSSWVSPCHLLTKDVLAVWAQQVEKATNGRVKLQMLPKHPSARARHLRCGQGWPRRCLLRHRQLHARPPRAAAAGRAAGRRRHLRDQLGGLLAHPLEVSAARSASTRASSCSASSRMDRARCSTPSGRSTRSRTSPA